MSDESFQPQSSTPAAAERHHARTRLRWNVASWVNNICSKWNLLRQGQAADRRDLLADQSYKPDNSRDEVAKDVEDQSVSVSQGVLVGDELERRRFDQAIASLSARDQQLVVWRTIHFVTYREIALRLKIPERVARRKCQAAMDAFRKAWSSQEHSN